MRAAVVVVALVTAGLAPPARAFTRTVNKYGATVFWRESCAPVTIYFNGFEQTTNKNGAVVQIGLTVEATLKSVTAAAHAWSTDAVPCADGQGPSLEIVPTVAPLEATPPAIADDARNVIVFRTDHWGQSGRSGLAWDYDPAGLARTTVWSAGDGHITDVDIEINATDPYNVWLDLDPGVGIPKTDPRLDNDITYHDLQTALTHEFGHFIGLDHTCFQPDKDTVHESDDTGNLVPTCSKASGDALASVMYASTGYAEVKRDLGNDDLRAVCAIYPSSRPSATCALDTPPPGCAVAPARRGRTPWAAALAAGVALTLFARGRRAGRRPPFPS